MHTMAACGLSISQRLLQPLQTHRYVCMHVCVYVCMYIRIDNACHKLIGVYVCMYVCMYVCIYVCVHKHKKLPGLYVCMYMHLPEEPQNSQCMYVFDNARHLIKLFDKALHVFVHAAACTNSKMCVMCVMCVCM